MAPDRSIALRASHLHESAHLLARACPAISRHLRSELHGLSVDHSIDLSETQKAEACAACGNLTVPGWTSHTYIDTPNKKHEAKAKKSGRNRPRKTAVPADRGDKDKTEKTMITECLICNRKTRHSLPARAKSRSGGAEHGASSRGPVPVPRTTDESTRASPTPLSSNASSRKRAKARKQTGLQMLLAKKRTEGHVTGDLSSGFGLDLMDFMKNG